MFLARSKRKCLLRMPLRLWSWLDERGSFRPFGWALRLVWPRLHFCDDLDGLLVVGDDPADEWRCECVRWPE